MTDKSGVRRVFAPIAFSVAVLLMQACNTSNNKPDAGVAPAASDNAATLTSQPQSNTPTPNTPTSNTEDAPDQPATNDDTQQTPPAEGPAPENQTPANTPASTESNEELDNDGLSPFPDTQFSASQTGLINHPALAEISGLAVSRLRNGLLWAINDSGNPARLYALDTSGQLLASLNLDVVNRDWEDMATVVVQDQPYLVIADIGDNLGIHDHYTLHFFAEPLLDNALLPNPLTPTVSINYRYEDGPHNSEAIAIADNDNTIYLVSKADTAKVYAIELDLPGLLATNTLTTDTAQTLMARQVAVLDDIEQSLQDSLLGNLVGVNLANITSMDLAGDNQSAWLMSYRGIYRIDREPQQTWAQAFSGELHKVHSHTLAQGEALAVSDAEIAVYFTSEKLPAPLWKLSAGQ